jgi:hypothetical protein
MIILLGEYNMHNFQQILIANKYVDTYNSRFTHMLNLKNSFKDKNTAIVLRISPQYDPSNDQQGIQSYNIFQHAYDLAFP